jgi:Calcineurin-like phosphoesterase
MAKEFCSQVVCAHSPPPPPPPPPSPRPPCSEFLAAQPHRYKLVVAGNHEVALNGYSREEVRDMLPHCTHYLQDRGCEVEGVHFYGSPWTASRHMGFSASRADLAKRWKRIPLDTDVVLTHMPPRCLLDLASRRAGADEPCEECGQRHRTRKHWGCASLRAHMLERVKPAVHVFGHVHEEAGVLQLGETLFVNAALERSLQPVVVDLVFGGGEEDTGKVQVNEKRRENRDITKSTGGRESELREETKKESSHDRAERKHKTNRKANKTCEKATGRTREKTSKRHSNKS